MTLEDYIVGQDTKIIDVMNVIDKNARGIAFVCDGKKLLGAVTDGDIRRYILEKGDLDQAISKVASYDCKYLSEGDKRNAIKVMKKYSISAIPIVDNDMNIIDIKFLWEKGIKTAGALNIPLVIMAGGKGARLKPYTDILPKPLIPIGDMTITEHIMNRFGEYECNDVTMIINYKKNFIKAYYMDSDIKQQIRFVEEEEFLGTGGGIKLLQGMINRTFFLTNCDILVDADYEKIYSYHVKNNNIITMVCAKKQITVPYGTVEVDEEGHVISMQEKPTFTFNTNTGLYVISPEFIEKIPRDTFIHITDVIQNCLDENERVGVYLIEDDQWMDMGQLEEMEKMKEKMGLS